MPDFSAALSMIQAVLGAQRVLQLRGHLLALVAREAVHDACAHRYAHMHEVVMHNAQLSLHRRNAQSSGWQS